MISDGRTAGPDFICIGMAKAGTGWLFDQVSTHPDFWMPPVKALHYLGSEPPHMPHVSKRLARRSPPVRGRPSGELDFAFLHDASRLQNEPRDLLKYAALFQYKGARLSGDICTTYADLKEKEIAEIAEYLPNAKILLLVRDPVALAWSRISMAYRRGKFAEDILQNLGEFRDFIGKARSLNDERPRPTQIVDRWARFAPNLQFRTFLLDEIEREPERARREMLAYLGADPDKSSRLAATYNRKAGAAKLALTEPVKAILVERYACEIFACAEAFGGYARDWPKRYNLV